MAYSAIDYFKIIKYAIKNRKIRKFVNLKWQTILDRFKKIRIQEYINRSERPDDVLVRIFPGKSVDYKILIELENRLNNFKKEMEKVSCHTITNPYPINFGLDLSFCRFLFSLCKLHEPEIVIETGVANGFSSSYILFAMDSTKKGKLISIDDLMLPWHTKEKMGQAIPEYLRNRQTLIVGDAFSELKKILNSTIQIDIFIHDSEHTYQNMINEFRIAWPHIKSGGFLLSDDVFRNDAFLDFSDEVRCKPIIISGEKEKVYFGVIQK